MENPPLARPIEHSLHDPFGNSQKYGYLRVTGTLSPPRRRPEPYVLQRTISRSNTAQTLPTLAWRCPKQPLSPVRRIVNSTTPEGKAIIHTDATLEPCHSAHAAMTGTDEVGLSLLWPLRRLPAETSIQQEIPRGTSNDLAACGEPTIHIMDIPPCQSSRMYRTARSSFTVVLEGQLTLELEDAMDVIIKRGNVNIQMGPIHAWHNRSKTTTRVLLVLMAAVEA